MMDNHQIKTKIKTNLSGFLRVCIVGLLVVLQLIFIIVLSLVVSQYNVYFYAILEILSIILIIPLVNDSRSASYKIAWICTVLLLPLTGHIMYLLWGKADSKKKIEKNVVSKLRHGFEFYEIDKELEKEFCERFPEQSRISSYMTSEHFPLFKNNEISYYPMGEEVFEVIYEDLRKAKQFILINFFIIGEGIVWNTIHEILLAKIKEGVEVKFMYDDFGAALRTNKYFKRNLEQEGFQIQVFNPIHKYTEKLYMNYRSHQKILIVDGNIGYTGGINLADEYANIIQRFGTWKDNAIRIEGDAVWGLTVTFLQMWEVCSEGSPLIDYSPYRPTKQFAQNETYCHVISDGPANNPNNPIENTYKQMIYYAKKYLYIMTPYLVIEDDLRDALIMAARSGVDVRLITPYIPDKKSVKILTNYNYGKLLKNGIRIYEYLPGFIHAKTILNEETAIVGTINMDYRSFYLHYECGVWMYHSPVLDTIKEDMRKTMAVSRQVSYEEWKKRPFWLKVCQPVLNLFCTLM